MTEPAIGFRTPISKLIAEKYRERRNEVAPVGPRPKILTEREAQILKLIGEGFTNKEIGVKLSMHHDGTRSTPKGSNITGLGQRPNQTSDKIVSPERAP